MKVLSVALKHRTQWTILHSQVISGNYDDGDQT